MTPQAREKEQRLHNRESRAIPVEYRSKTGEIVQATTINVSRGGMFIETKQPLSHGSRAFFQVQVTPNAMNLHLEGEVIWAQRRRSARSKTPCGMGVRFLTEVPGSEKLLEAFLPQAS